MSFPRGFAWLSGAVLLCAALTTNFASGEPAATAITLASQIERPALLVRVAAHKSVSMAPARRIGKTIHALWALWVNEPTRDIALEDVAPRAHAERRLRHVPHARGPPNDRAL